MSLAKKVAENSAVLIVGELLRNVLSLVSVFFVARFLGAYDFGVINFAFAYLYFFEMIPRFGFDAIVGREMAKDSTDKSLLLGNSMMLRFLFALIGIAAAFAVLVLMKKPGNVMLIVGLASFSIFFTLQISYETVLRTFLEMKWAVIINLVKQTLYLALVVIGALAKWPLWYFVLATVAAGVFSLAAYAIAANRFVVPRFQWNRSIVLELLRESWPVAISSVLCAILFRFGVIVLEKFRGFEAVGKYSAAYKLVEALAMIPSAWASSVYPLMSKFYKNETELFKKTSFYSFKFLILIALPMCIIISFFSRDIIHLIYGHKYEGADAALQILIWSALFSFPNYILACLNFATGKQSYEMAVRAVCSAVSVALNLILIPKISYLGCAAAWAIAEGLYFFLCLSYLGHYLVRDGWIRLSARLIGVNALLYLFLKLFQNAPFIPVAVAGGLGSFGFLFFMRIFDADEKQLIRKAIFSRFRFFQPQPGNI